MVAILNWYIVLHPLIGVTIVPTAAATEAAAIIIH